MDVSLPGALEGLVRADLPLQTPADGQVQAFLAALQGEARTPEAPLSPLAPATPETLRQTLQTFSAAHLAFAESAEALQTQMAPILEQPLPQMKAAEAQPAPTEAPESQALVDPEAGPRRPSTRPSSTPDQGLVEMPPAPAPLSPAPATESSPAPKAEMAAPQAPLSASERPLSTPEAEIPTPMKEVPAALETSLPTPEAEIPTPMKEVSAAPGQAESAPVKAAPKAVEAAPTVAPSTPVAPAEAPVAEAAPRPEGLPAATPETLHEALRAFVATQADFVKGAAALQTAIVPLLEHLSPVADAGVQGSTPGLSPATPETLQAVVQTLSATYADFVESAEVLQAAMAAALPEAPKAAMEAETPKRVAPEEAAPEVPQAVPFLPQALAPATPESVQAAVETLSATQGAFVESAKALQAAMAPILAQASQPEGQAALPQSLAQAVAALGAEQAAFTESVEALQAAMAPIVAQGAARAGAKEQVVYIATGRAADEPAAQKAPAGLVAEGAYVPTAAGQTAVPAEVRAAAAPAQAALPAVFTEAVEAVVKTLGVKPSGTLVVRLDAQVLDGSEVRISAEGGRLSVAFAPANEGVRQLLVQHQAQLVEVLGERLAGRWQVSVAVGSAWTERRARGSEHEDA